METVSHGFVYYKVLDHGAVKYMKGVATIN